MALLRPANEKTSSIVPESLLPKLNEIRQISTHYPLLPATQLFFFLFFSFFSFCPVPRGVCKIPKECSLFNIYYVWGTDSCLLFRDMVNIFSNQKSTCGFRVKGYFIKQENRVFEIKISDTLSFMWHRKNYGAIFHDFSNTLITSI